MMERSTIDASSPAYLHDFILDDEVKGHMADNLTPSRNNNDDDDDDVRNKLQQRTIQPSNQSNNNHYDESQGQSNGIGISISRFSGDADELMKLLEKNEQYQQQVVNNSNDGIMMTLHTIFFALFAGCTILIILVFLYKARTCVSKSKSNQSDSIGTTSNDRSKTKVNIDDKSSRSKDLHQNNDNKNGNCKGDDQDNSKDSDQERSKGIEGYQVIQIKREEPQSQLSRIVPGGVPALLEELEICIIPGIDKAKVAEITAMEMIRNHNEAFDRLGHRAKESINELYEAIRSTFGGSHLLFCIILGCGVILVGSNVDTIQQFVKNEDPVSLFDTSLQWVSVNICGCLKSTGSTIPINDSSLQVDSSVSNSWWFLTMIPSISTSTTLPSMIDMLSFYSRCLFKILLIPFSHRVISAFHCPPLHQIFNLTVLLFTTVNTRFGRSILTLLLKICVINAFTCCMAYVYYSKAKKVVDSATLSPGGVGVGGESTIGQRHQQLRDVRDQSEQVKLKMYLFTAVAATVSGMASLAWRMYI